MACYIVYAFLLEANLTPLDLRMGPSEYGRQIPATIDENGSFSANGPTGKVTVAADEVAQKIEGFHTAKRSPWSVLCVRFSPGGESYTSRSEDGVIRMWQTGPTTIDENGSFSANGPTGKVKVTADEVAQKIEGFHIAKDEETETKEDIDA